MDAQAVSKLLMYFLHSYTDMKNEHFFISWRSFRLENPFKYVDDGQWALIMKNAKYSLMSRCQNNSKCFSMEQKNGVHWKGTTFVKMFTRKNIIVIVNAFLWNKKWGPFERNCIHLRRKKYRGAYFRKFCDNYHGTGDFEPFSEKFLTF